MGWKRAAWGAATAAVGLGFGATGGARDGVWPDSQVGTQWPTFASIAAPESGGGGLAGWNGAFLGCVPSPRYAFDYACEYSDGEGRLGYVCVAAAEAGAPVTQASIDARVGPDDPTYGDAAPTAVCNAALAYRLSLG